MTTPLGPNPLGWPSVKGALTCPECGAPAVEGHRPGANGDPVGAYTIKCSACWKAQCTDPTSTRSKSGY